VLSRVLRTIRDEASRPRASACWLLCRAVPDSSALLHSLATVAPRLGISLVAACVDHQLRPESGEEARGVLRRCQGMGIPCEILEVDVGRARKPMSPRRRLLEKCAWLRWKVRPLVLGVRRLQLATPRRPSRNRALPHVRGTRDRRAQRHTVPARPVRATLARRASRTDPDLPAQAQDRLLYRSLQRKPPLCPLAHSSRRASLLAQENPRVVEALLSLAREASDKETTTWREGYPPTSICLGGLFHAVDRLVREAAARERSLCETEPSWLATAQSLGLPRSPSA